MTEPLRLERNDQDRSAELVLSKPPLQILDLDLLERLEVRLGELAAIPDLQAVVLRAEGGKAFCAGVSVQDHVPDRLERTLGAFHGAIRALRALDAFTLAVVDGACLGGGMELVCACDYVLAGDRARFGQPEIQLGCFPPVATALLPRRIGSGIALELILSGRTIDADEALALGLVQERVSSDSLPTRVRDLVGTVTAKSAVATRLAKRAVRAGELRPFDAALAEAERLYLRELAGSHDMSEGIEAFLAKRVPVWKHR
jgi:cyclohexa-1,5-dienecarbonyl-CoA hydratase